MSGNLRLRDITFKLSLHNLKQCWLIASDGFENKQWKANEKTNPLAQENSFENVVYGMQTILHQEQWVIFCIFDLHKIKNSGT